MTQNRSKHIGRSILKFSLLSLFFGSIGVSVLTGGLKTPANPLSHKEVTKFESVMTEVFTYETTTAPQTFTVDDLLNSIENFVKTPEGGTSWQLFGKTTQTPYSYMDEGGMEWEGVRPTFPEELKKLDGKEILIQGYMFPLGQEEKQSLFLLGPFPVSCPYHYHVTPNLIIEVKPEKPIEFSYDAINVRGTLELVPKDDEYNVFYRLNNASLSQ